ncbi:MAG TPA: hemerythrin domain-containing protein [Candidatus Sulfotelmatobacter sp.]|nr:hemerythrin domain-containing protein [Candidatus Sulfotelmatobacter sp.]
MSQNIFEKIKEEHQEFKEMLGKLTEGRSSKEDTFEEFKTELKAHNKAEEQTLYEALMKDKKSKEMALVGIEEHRMGTVVLNKLDKATKGSEDWKVQLNVLKHMLEKHIEVEEAEVIPMAQGMLEETEVEELSEQFESIEEKLEK